MLSLGHIASKDMEKINLFLKYLDEYQDI